MHGCWPGEGWATLCGWPLDGLSLGAAHSAEARGLRSRKDCLRVPAGYLSTARSVREGKDTHPEAFRENLHGTCFLSALGVQRGVGTCQRRGPF